MTKSLLRPWTYFPLGLRAYRDTFRFTGRARRLEFGEFYIVSMLLPLIFLLPARWGLEIDMGSYRQTVLATHIASEAIKFVAMLPIFALMARRIQDFDRPGWAFPPLMVYVFCVNEWKSLSFIIDVEQPSWAYQLPAFAIVIVMMTSWFIPGTEGNNRYGPDPRLDDLADEPSAA